MFFSLLSCCFPKFSSSLKCVFKGSSRNFRKHYLNFFASLADNLVYPLLSHVVYFFGCIFYYAQINLSHLVDCIFTSIGKIILVQEAASLIFFQYFSRNLLFLCQRFMLNLDISSCFQDKKSQHRFLFYLDIFC